jgi:hypothetical protein
LAYAKELVQSGRAIRARVCVEAGYNYPGARSVSWQLGGFERVDLADVVEALAHMPGGHDYADDLSVTGVSTDALARSCAIKEPECLALLLEAKGANLVVDCEFKNERAVSWCTRRYWRMELAKIERAAAQNAQTPTCGVCGSMRFESYTEVTSDQPMSRVTRCLGCKTVSQRVPVAQVGAGQ